MNMENIVITLSRNFKRFQSITLQNRSIAWSGRNISVFCWFSTLDILLISRFYYWAIFKTRFQVRIKIVQLVLSILTALLLPCIHDTIKVHTDIIMQKLMHNY